MSTSPKSISIPWKAAGNNNPCIVCGAKRKCTSKIDATGNGVVKCCKQSAGAFKASSDSIGESYFHRVKNGTPHVTAEPPELSPGRLDEIFNSLLENLSPVGMKHKADLLKRGLSVDLVQSNKYRTLDLSHAYSCAKSLQATFGDDAFSIPGFHLSDDGDPRLSYLYVNRKPIQPVLLIPLRNRFGQILAIKLRINDPAWTGEKYIFLTSSKTGGRKANQAVHVPLGTPSLCSALRVTEGELKSDIAFHLSGTPTISLPGVSSWRKALPVILEFGATDVLLAFDADAKSNPHVALSLSDLYRELNQAGIKVSIEHWDISNGKGIDDLLHAGHKPNVACDDEAESLVTAWFKSSGAEFLKNKQATTDVAEVFCGLNELFVNDRAVEQLAKVKTVFQRGGSLVHVVRESPPAPGIERPPGLPSIANLPESGLREILSSIIRFQEERGRGEEKQLYDIRVPGYVSKAIHQRGQWKGIRKLESVVTFPVLRVDGSIAATSGYDPQTGFYLDVEPGLVNVPDTPTQEDAQNAVLVLHALVSDFPFEQLAHRSGWMALLLTVLARCAFNGCAPLFMVDANCAGSGKTLVISLVSLITAGHDLARMANPREDEEARKRITAIAISGESFILIDNIDGEFGSPALDSAITSTIWSDRILGKSATVTLPLYVTWAATGNNIILTSDLQRRICHIRLLSPEERPEERSGFAIPNIELHVQRNRSAYLSAALTILKAYIVAGKPDMKLKHWGSFEGWSGLVRSALVWAGDIDPGESRDELIERNNIESGSLLDLMDAWEGIDPDTKGLTAKAAANMLEYIGDGYTTIKNAIYDFCGIAKGKPVTSKILGKKLARIQGKVCDGKCFDAMDNGHKTNIWFVRKADDKHAKPILDEEF